MMANYSKLHDDPFLTRLAAQEPSAWFNPAVTTTAAGLYASDLSRSIVDDAAARLDRFAPWIAQAFPETSRAHGIIESPLDAAPDMQRELGLAAGTLLLKRDDILPVSCSIKARGGVHEVLEYAESLAAEAGLLPTDYQEFGSAPVRRLMAQHRVVVGSTGNLGLSIGITSAALGLQATVHMSTHAQAWKKELLRGLGVEVVEHSTDYTAAVDAGRQAVQTDPTTHFVDDEHSVSLFAGYAVAGRRVARQLRDQGITVAADHPLFVYLPCGIGGAPGGVAYGLALEFGDAVHCIFAEPTAAPAMMLGVYTGLHDQISVSELGLDTRTVADGLAVGRPSGFVGRRMQGLIDGYYTVTDQHMKNQVKLLHATEGILAEPSAVAGLDGPHWISTDTAYLNRTNLTDQRLRNITHIAWLTGGGMVPAEVQRSYLS
ncbi:D-serine ammonia-lyase [Kocuria sp. cx-455]|uniref:D-serine ammonia-lyase n=1 Tax=Kocuria sp. cx-455 TaxID=2771377 RepID=UPI003D729801